MQGSQQSASTRHGSIGDFDEAEHRRYYELGSTETAMNSDFTCTRSNHSRFRLKVPATAIRKIYNTNIASHVLFLTFKLLEMLVGKGRERRNSIFRKFEVRNPCAAEGDCDVCSYCCVGACCVV
jgi:hypothetical protein